MQYFETFLIVFGSLSPIVAMVAYLAWDEGVI